MFLQYSWSLAKITAMKINKQSTKFKGQRFVYLSAFFVISVLLILFFPFNKKDNSSISTIPTTDKNLCLGDECLDIENLNYPIDTLPEEIKNTLDQAIEDEYKAYSTYLGIIKKFGNVRPFNMIIRAEEQHISVLKTIYDKYGINIPNNTWTDKISLPSTIKEACRLGFDAETSNISLYQENLIPLVKKYSDITSVYKNLMNASLQKHLPAFDKCR